MSKNIIRDGYTRDGYVAPLDGIHEGLAFTYRPMLSEAVISLDASIDKTLANGGAALLISDEVQKHLVTWSEVDEKGEQVPITVDNIRRLPHVLLKTLHLVLAGIRASDPRPKATEKDQADRLEELRAMVKGEAPGQALLESARKN